MTAEFGVEIALLAFLLLYLLLQVVQIIQIKRLHRKISTRIQEEHELFTKPSR